jgi:hypothetical protein
MTRTVVSIFAEGFYVCKVFFSSEGFFVGKEFFTAKEIDRYVTISAPTIT